MTGTELQITPARQAQIPGSGQIIAEIAEIFDVPPLFAL